MLLNIFEVITQETAVKVKAAIDALKAGETLELCILSGGGDAFAGVAISDMLISCSLNTISRVYGYAASAASLIALSCKHVELASNACLMVHSAYADNEDDEDQKPIEIINAAQVNVIKRRLPEFDMKALKTGDTWFTAEEALKLGLCDEIINVGSVAASAAAYNHFVQSTLEGEKKMENEEVVSVPVEQVEEVREEDKLDAIMSAIERIDARLKTVEEKLSAAEQLKAEEEKKEEENKDIVARCNNILGCFSIPTKKGVEAEKPKQAEKRVQKRDLSKFV